jgi:PAS domain S-box-containing protein
MAANQEQVIGTEDILVVDDTLSSLRMLTEILAKAGYKTRPVEDPQLALEAALAQPPSLILLDVRMPNMSGFELSQRLKQDERTRDVPIIFVSALDDLHDRIQGFEVGAVDYIAKPIHEAEVLARVNTHLQLRNTLLYQEKLVAEKTAELAKLLDERSQALNSAEAQIRTMFQNSPVGIALTTFTGEYLTVNKAFLTMLRVSSEEKLKREAAIYFYANPADRDTLLAEVRKFGSVHDFGVQVRRYDGDLFFASVNMSRLYLHGNEILLTMVEDVTDRIEAEKLMESLAAETERKRLARELHDSVTQTLYSSRMIAEATPGIMDKDPILGKQNLVMLSDMIRGALAEMRSLLLELRSEVFQNLALGKLLEPLVVAFQARTRAEINLEVVEDCQLPEEIKINFYRITREALNNIAKHAEASHVHIHLVCHTDEIFLKVTDDGRGFNPEHIHPGHLGVDIMREHAQNIGAAFQISSKTGEGTSIIVSWSNEKNGEL